MRCYRSLGARRLRHELFLSRERLRFRELRHYPVRRLFCRDSREPFFLRHVLHAYFRGERLRPDHERDYRHL